MDLPRYTPEARTAVRRSARRAFARLLARVRQNFFLKVVSLVAAVVLYVFVQADRNPFVTRNLIAGVDTAGRPSAVDVELDRQQVLVSVSGPKAVVDRLSDGDVRAVADLGHLDAASSKEQIVRLSFIAPELTPAQFHNLTVDTAVRTLRVRVFPPQSKLLDVAVFYPNEPPAGFVYGDERVTPPRVTISGRSDRVSRVERVVVNAAPPSAGATIDGTFPLLARDRDGNPVENVTLAPKEVRVRVPLVEALPVKIVPVNTDYDLPAKPYVLIGLETFPARVKVRGRPERLEQIPYIDTERLSLDDVTDSREFTARLIVPPDIAVLDADDNPIQHVKVRVKVRRDGRAAPAASPGDSTPPGPASQGDRPPPGESTGRNRP